MTPFEKDNIITGRSNNTNARFLTFSGGMTSVG
jgi:hypothetical protein